MKKRMTLREVKSRIEGLDEDTQKSVVCALVGHSKVVSSGFGYVTCRRCGSQIGDTLAGCFDLKECVIEGCDCRICRSNYEKMNWKDKFMSPNPFGDKT